MHLYHHAYALPKDRFYGVNFGISLSLWDYIFKTNYIPHSGRDIEIGFNNYNQGLNPKKGLTGSGHSTQVIGYDERGVPVIYDYGDYLPIDKLGLDCCC